MLVGVDEAIGIEEITIQSTVDISARRNSASMLMCVLCTGILLATLRKNVEKYQSNI